MRAGVKKRYQKRFMALFLTVITLLTIILSGCSKGQSGEQGGENTEKKQARGKYVEQMIEIPWSDGERGISLVKDTAGEYHLYTQVQDQYKMYRSKDGITFEEGEAGWLNSGLFPDGGYMVNITAGEDGKEYALYYGNERNIVVQTQDGKKAEEVLPQLFEKSGMLDGVMVLSNGDLVLFGAGGDKAEVYSAKDGSKLQSFRQGSLDMTGTKVFDCRENLLLMINKEVNGFQIVDLKTGEMLQEISFGNLRRDSGVLRLGENEDFYFLNKEGLHHMTNKGSTVETIVEGETASMGDQTIFLVDFRCGTQNDYLALYNQNGQNGQLVRYIYDENVAVNPEKTLTIYGLEDNETIRQSVSRFQKEHTDVKVNYKIGSQEGSTTTADQIRVLNTELLSKSGADILILDGLPVDSYIEKGVLEDLTDFYSGLSENGVLLSNVADSMKKQGKIYGLPARVKIPYMYGPEEKERVITSLDQLEAYLKEHSDQKFTQTKTFEQYLKLLITVYYKELFETEKKEISEELLSKLLRVVNQLGESTETEYKSLEEFYQTLSKESQEIMQDYYEERFGTGNDIEARKGEQLAVGAAKGISDLMMPCEVMKQLGIKAQGINGLYIPVGIAGINSASNNKDLAREFLELLFSQEVQTLDLGDGFPVNGAALDEWCSKPESDAYGNQVAVEVGGTEDGEVFSAAMPSGAQITVFAEIEKNADTPVQMDRILLEMIVDGGISYFKNEKSLEEAVSDITAKARTYLSE